MTLDEFRARRRDLVARIGTEKANTILGLGDVEQQFGNVLAVEDKAEHLAGLIFHARLAFQGARAEASAIHRERDFRPERSIFVETAGQASTRADIAETELQRLQQKLAELVAVADDTGLWSPSERVRTALEGEPRSGLPECGVALNYNG